MECKEVTQLLDNLDVEPLSGDEEINDDLLNAFTDFYEKLVLSGNLKTLVTQLESVKDLEENDATKCAIMYIATVFITEAMGTLGNAKQPQNLLKLPTPIRCVEP